MALVLEGNFWNFKFEPLSCLAGNFFQGTFEPSTTDRQLVDFTTALDDGQTIVGVGLLVGHGPWPSRLSPCSWMGHGMIVIVISDTVCLYPGDTVKNPGFREADFWLRYIWQHCSLDRMRGFPTRSIPNNVILAEIQSFKVSELLN